MAAAALRVAHALGYSSAGTVEMILAPDGAFYFLEVNTRLQVEHPVTELVLDVDLVELQLRVARGERLPFDQGALDAARSGAAIECRLYAEDPEGGFLPQSGRILDWQTPQAAWLRVDAGVQTDTEVGIHYDPMLAKVITWGADRGDAIQRMRWALARLSVLGPATNRDFLRRVLDHEAFVAGEVHTHFIEEHATRLLIAEPDTARITEAARMAALQAQAERAERSPLPGIRTGFRNNRFADQETRFETDAGAVVVRYADLGGGRFRVTTEMSDAEPRVSTVRRVAVDGPAVTVEDERGLRRTARVARDEQTGRWCCQVGGWSVVLREVPRFADRGDESAADGCAAPMPGQIVRVLVTENEVVETGQPLLIMEAMKMEHTIRAPHGGVVAQLSADEGAQVGEGELLVVVVEPTET